MRGRAQLHANCTDSKINYHVVICRQKLDPQSPRTRAPNSCGSPQFVAQLPRATYPGARRSAPRSHRAGSRRTPRRHGTRRSAARCTGRDRSGDGRRRHSKSRLRISGASGGPGLSTSSTAACGSRRSRMVIVAPGKLKSTALSMSLSSICTIRSGAPSIVGASPGNSVEKARSGKAIRYAPAADAISATRSNRVRSALLIASSTRVAAPMATRIAFKRSLPCRARSRYRRAEPDTSSDSRFSRDERTIVSGVRISWASLPASVRRYPVYSLSRPRRVENPRATSPSSSGAAVSGKVVTSPSRVRADSLARRNRDRRTASRAANANIAITATALVIKVKLSIRVSARSRRL